MKTARLALALLLTPLLAAVVFAVGQPLVGGDMAPLAFRDYFLGGLLMAGPFAYAIALVLGVPMFILLKALGQLKFWVVSSAGLVAGLCVGFWALWIYPPAALLCGLGGFVAAATFWLIACWPPGQSPKPTPTASGPAPDAGGPGSIADRASVMRPEGIGNE